MNFSEGLVLMFFRNKEVRKLEVGLGKRKFGHFGGIDDPPKDLIQTRGFVNFRESFLTENRQGRKSEQPICAEETRDDRQYHGQEQACEH